MRSRQRSRNLTPFRNSRRRRSWVSFWRRGFRSASSQSSGTGRAAAPYLLLSVLYDLRFLRPVDDSYLKLELFWSLVH
jgi:hypothetical protein